MLKEFLIEYSYLNEDDFKLKSKKKFKLKEIKLLC